MTSGGRASAAASAPTPSHATSTSWPSLLSIRARVSAVSELSSAIKSRRGRDGREPSADMVKAPPHFELAQDSGSRSGSAIPSGSCETCDFVLPCSVHWPVPIDRHLLAVTPLSRGLIDVGG